MESCRGGFENNPAPHTHTEIRRYQRAEVFRLITISCLYLGSGMVGIGFLVGIRARGDNNTNIYMLLDVGPGNRFSHGGVTLPICCSAVQTLRVEKVTNAKINWWVIYHVYRVSIPCRVT